MYKLCYTTIWLRNVPKPKGHLPSFFVCGAEYINEIRGLQSVPTHVVIAISSALYRKGLSSLFSSEIFSVCEVETENELADKLKTEPVDFVIVGQSLIKDISLLPKGKFILIA